MIRLVLAYGLAHPDRKWKQPPPEKETPVNMTIYRCPCGAEFPTREEAEWHKGGDQVLAATLARMRVTIARAEAAILPGGEPEPPTAQHPSG